MQAVRVGHEERPRHGAQIWEEYRTFHQDRRNALPTYAELRADPGVMWPFVGGRETKWRCNTSFDPAADRARGEFDFYGHDDHRAWVELCLTAGIWALGLFVLTVLVRVALPIELGEVRSPYIDSARPAPTIRPRSTRAQAAAVKPVRTR